MGAILLHLVWSESLISFCCVGNNIPSSSVKSLAILSFICEYLAERSFRITLASLCLHSLMMLDQAFWTESLLLLLTLNLNSTLGG